MNAEGTILKIISNKPIVVYPNTTIKKVCSIMVDNGIRRVPVVETNNKKLKGVISARDLVDFFGGGEKYNLVTGKYEGNLFKAINQPIEKIMTEDVVKIKETDTVDMAAAKMLESNVGGCPVVNKENVVVGFVSEGDFIKNITDGILEKEVSNFMCKDVISATPGTSIGDACKVMINKSVRRLPVIHECELVGMLRSTSVLRFISSNEFSKFGTIDADEILRQEKVGDAMSPYFTTVRPKDNMESVIEIMMARRSGGLVVENNGKIAGIVTEHDVFKAAYLK